MRTESFHGDNFQMCCWESSVFSGGVYTSQISDQNFIETLEQGVKYV